MKSITFFPERYYFIKDKTYHIIPGDLVLININDLHKTTEADTSAHERILINFTRNSLLNCNDPPTEAALFDCFTSGANVLRFDIKDRTRIEALLNKMLFETEHQNFGHQVMIKTYLFELLILIKRHMEQTPEISLELKHGSYEKIYDILRFINQHYAEDISLHYLSNSFYISPFHLSRTFRKVTGFSFIEYLNSIRIKEAERFLRSGNEKITQIAATVGFDSLTHFGRVFKTVTGLSPLQYRKKNTIR
jgi:AraC-like DNA-binding protein